MSVPPVINFLVVGVGAAAGVYVGGSVLLGLAATFLGVTVTRLAP
jgi:hypothetical protein